MAIRDIFKISFKTFVNPGAWIDYAWLKNQTTGIWEIIRDLFTIDRPEREETFEQAMQRLGVTEADVRSGVKRYRLVALVFCLFGLAIFFYSFYILFRYHVITGWILGIAASGVAFAQAFRFDFFALQMKKRRLGLTFQDWKRNLLGDKGSST